MGSTVENIDEASLAEAQRLLGTSSNKDTVNAALKEVVRQKLVQEFIDMMRAQDPQELERLRARAWE
ncbi:MULTISPECIES: type II toxin-antitoxin system VapB family antitoxin [unclassified Kitasatospora]|uniref:type II toxin-antitoxin system VapB family antitoxin n=1 Tax=unclassified Kitasatospora TaxID=2633591 RepID=UPI0009E7889D|nr:MULTISPECIES: type II toxin-antitoxin system VapB family antitoxin [unclassified Kitasatospora]